MGRRNRKFRHSAEMIIELDAPDNAEAGRRIEDVTDVLQLRFFGAEIYPQLQPGNPRRIAGHPRVLRITALPGLPVEVDPFEHEGVPEPEAPNDAESLEKVTDERDRYRQALETLATIQGEVVPVVNDEMVRMEWVLDVVNRALHPRKQ